MIVYAVVDDAVSPEPPLGDAIETFIRREDSERFMGLGIQSARSGKCT